MNSQLPLFSVSQVQHLLETSLGGTRERTAQQLGQILFVPVQDNIVSEIAGTRSAGTPRDGILVTLAVGNTDLPSLPRSPLILRLQLLKWYRLGEFTYLAGL